MVKQHRVEEIVRSAWARRLLVLTVERVAIGAAIILAAFILMLLAGTQVLNGYWLLAAIVGGFGLVAYQVRQRVVAHYQVAQLVDQRLHLADSLSTAWYLLSTPGRPGNAFSEFQLKAADATARTVDVRGAFPFTGKRLWWVAGGLAVLALSLFWVRYLVTDSLSLRASLIPLRLSEVFERRDKDSNETKRQRELTRGIEPRGQKNTPKTDGRKDGKEEGRLEPPALAAASQQGQNPSDPAQLRASKEAPGKEGQEKRAGAEGNARQREGQKQGDKGDESAASQKPASEDGNNPQSSNGLMDRMKDALSSLAAKMRPQSPEQEHSNQRSAENKKGEQQGGPKEQNDPSRQNANQQASEQQQAAADGQAQGQTQETSRSGQGKTADPLADKTKSGAHSGIGSQDGEKDVKEIDQLQAMGKLAEIIGKRSASATGEVMVENSSGKQHLETEYSGRLTQHADLGGEINRDEIPLMYQQYVREYMSEVRRQAKQQKP